MEEAELNTELAAAQQQKAKMESGLTALDEEVF
jgi:hypothetical protein